MNWTLDTLLNDFLAAWTADNWPYALGFWITVGVMMFLISRRGSGARGDSSGPRSQTDRTVDRSLLVTVVAVIAVANFLAFCLVAEVIGGDAINGYAEDGRYFLRLHGKVTEVSQAVFTHSKWHVISVFITHSVAIVAGLLWANGQRSS